MGYVSAGKHTVHLQSPQSNTWGCGGSWGDLDLLVLPRAPGIAVYQAQDTRDGCPPRAGANTVLLKQVPPSRCHCARTAGSVGCCLCVCVCVCVCVCA